MSARARPLGVTITEDECRTLAHLLRIARRMGSNEVFRHRCDLFAGLLDSRWNRLERRSRGRRRKTSGLEARR